IRDFHVTGVQTCALPIFARLLAPHGDIARKRVTLLYRPIDAARAASIVEADLRAAEFRLTASDKPTARDAVATRAARATANEERSEERRGGEGRGRRGAE